MPGTLGHSPSCPPGVPLPGPGRWPLATECCVGSVAVAVKDAIHFPRVERHLQHLVPQPAQPEVDHNEPLELIVAHVTV